MPKKKKCNKDCLNCILPKCIHDIEDEKEARKEAYLERKKLCTQRWNETHKEYNRARAKAWYEANRESHKAKALKRYWEKKEHEQL